MAWCDDPLQPVSGTNFQDSIRPVWMKFRCDCHDAASRTFSFLDGVSSSYHGISHHRNEPDGIAEFEKIGTWHVAQLAYPIDRLRGLKEGDSTLLENSMVFFGTTIRDGNKHDVEDLPLILAGRGGGTIRTGRRLTAPKKTRLCNLFRAMMRRMGVEAETFGTSDGIVDLS